MGFSNYARSNLAVGWTDERVELLTKLWVDGYSASQIARELGGVTRAAVIGKVHRLGIPGRVKKPKAGSPRRPRQPRTSSYRPSRLLAGLGADFHNAALKAPCAEPEIDAASDSIIPFAQRKTILELNAQTCRWPVGDPCTADFFFCGGQPQDELPYCAFHARIAYQILRPQAPRHAPQGSIIAKARVFP